MVVELLPIGMFIVLMLLVFTSYPIGFVLGGISIMFGVIGWAAGMFSFVEFFNFAPRIWFIADNFQIIAVPLFVFMGVMLERSEIAKELLDTQASSWGYGDVCNRDGDHFCRDHRHHWRSRGRNDANRFAPHVKGRIQADTGIGHNRCLIYSWHIDPSQYSAGVLVRIVAYVGGLIVCGFSLSWVVAFIALSGIYRNFYLASSQCGSKTSHYRGSVVGY